MSVKKALETLTTAVDGYTTEAEAFLDRMGRGQLDPTEIQNTLEAATQGAIQEVLTEVDGLDVAELAQRFEIQRHLVEIQNAFDPYTKFFFEFFASLYTVADYSTIGAFKAVAGDDSMDCASTASLEVGKEYLVSGPAGQSFSVTVAEILSEVRFLATADAPVDVLNGTMRRTTWESKSGYATAVNGAVYYSKDVNLDATVAGNKALIVRSDADETGMSVYFKDSLHGPWTAISWALKRPVANHENLTDVEYSFPAKGLFDLKIVAAKGVTISHMVGMSHGSGLGGIARAPETPVNVSPVDGATDVIETPTLALDGYTHGSSVPFASAQFQVSTVADFATTVYEATTTTSLALSMPAGKLLANTTAYHWRGRVQDSNGTWSDWSSPTAFTTMVTFAYLATPVNVSPGAGAAELDNGLHLVTSAFSVVGSSSTHAASQYQISTDAGFATVIYDSGESASLTDLTVPGEPFSPNTTYFWRCRHKATLSALGWSNWSAGTSFSTGSMSYVEDVFSISIHNGNSSTQNVKTGLNFLNKPGTSFIKGRNSGGTPGKVFDTIRGVGKMLDLTSTAAQATGAGLVGFLSDGFSLSGNDGALNMTGIQYVSWNWLKAKNFLDMVTWVGDGTADRRIPHDLGCEGGFIITKAIDGPTDHWSIVHRANGANYVHGYLNLNSALAHQGWPFSEKVCSSTTFQVGSNWFPGANSNGLTYEAWIFAHDPSENWMIRCGSFTTDASGAATVDVGDEIQFLMCKHATVAGTDWHIIDEMRGFSMGVDGYLMANRTDAESSVDLYDPTPTGFVKKPGGSQGEYVYMVIRKGPMRKPTDATKVFKAIQRSGTGAATTVSGVGFSPDIVFSQSITGQFSANGFFDKLRGATNRLGVYSGQTLVEQNDLLSLTGFTSDGFTLGTDTMAGTLNLVTSYITYSYKRSPYFLDEVCDKGTGSAHNVQHRLKTVPELMMRKNRGTEAYWEVWHSSLGANEKLFLSADSKKTDATAWNATKPTETVFTVGTSVNTNAASANFVTYLMATCPGVSKVGSFVGNGTSLPVDCSFLSGTRFLLVKRVETVENWWIFDTVRGISLSSDPAIRFDVTTAQITTADAVDPWNPGFIIKQEATCNLNVSGGQYIFWAIA